MVGLQNSRISRLRDDIAELRGGTYPKPVLGRKLARVTADFQSISVAHDEITAHGGAVDDPYIVDNAYRDLRDLYEECDAEVTLLLEVDSSNMPAGSAAETQPRLTSRSVKLPEIHLPKFSGNIVDWMEFSDRFMSAIDADDGLSNSSKLSYLKGCLTGEAAALVKEVAITDSNYEIVWNRLKERYHNVRKIFDTHLARLEDLPRCSKGTRSELLKLVEKVKQAVDAIRSLGQTMRDDYWLVHRITAALDSNSRIYWNEYFQIIAKARSEASSSIPEHEIIPTYEDLLSFFNRRIAVLDDAAVTSTSTSSSTNKRPHQAGRSLHVQNSSGPSKRPRLCVCSEQHYIGNCSQFRGLSLKSRRDEARRLKLCYNCLGTDHGAQKCPSSKLCGKCQEKHHTQLCPKSSSGDDKTTA